MEAKDPDHASLQQQDPPVDQRLIVVCLLVSIVFFAAVNEAWRWLAQHYVTFAKMSQWRWRNLAVSWVHADFCTLGWCYWYFAYGHQVHSLSDLMDLKPQSAFYLVTFSTGYFMYDMLDHYWNGQMKAQWEVIVHHIAVLTIFGYNLLHQFLISCAVLALAVEINSVFLHGRKLLQMLNVPFTHWFYRLAATSNLASFLLFRGPPMVLIWACLIFHGDRLSASYWATLSTVMSFMVVLNCILFWRLIKNDLFRKQGRRSKKKEEEEEKDGEKRRGTLDGKGICDDGGDKMKSTRARSDMNQNGYVQNGGSKKAGEKKNGFRGGEDFLVERSEKNAVNRPKVS